MKDYYVPKPGDTIYVPSSLHVYRGIDDFAGGKAIVESIKYSDNLPEDHINSTMVTIEENPNTSYNWKLLFEKQDELEEMYGDRVAHPDPDYREEFNQPNADWQ